MSAVAPVAAQIDVAGIEIMSRVGARDSGTDAGRIGVARRPSRKTSLNSHNRVQLPAPQCAVENLVSACGREGELIYPGEPDFVRRVVRGRNAHEGVAGIFLRI